MENCSNIAWMIPWEPIKDKHEQFINELLKEVGDKHSLYGVKVKPIGRATNQDDVLFFIPERNIYAVVHLTWSGKKDMHPNFPSTKYFDTLEQWVEKCMKIDNKEFEG